MSILLAAASMLLPSTRTNAEILVDHTEAAGCTASIAGKPYRLSDERDQLGAALKIVAKEGRNVVIIGSDNTPYRCIGGLIYTLQLNGAAKVEFKTRN